ncbi:Piso0_004189 [Millerozyma farinosa CBS 7064]|uniref:Piso0_004189 protein n=1 Tax=Pichia sorbitophila (strain ATCC MYA-4447 / BCRC 22081 / CBS 7064 / NBRC 10061 / NRRL Y-12695) TaxID=559304 RepID=G8Y7Q6_PICSO|nr:Piso0_004189 [Millerozyma farinosa CBS 7064]CCE84636.1 Piso0_004189 [Millerozyma farinosa CBS 7064]
MEKQGESLSDSRSSLGKSLDGDETVQAQVDKLAEKYQVNERKLMWKIDVCVVPAFCFLYFLSFLDRVNISNAKLYGLAEDLKLTGTQYNTALTLFFVPYIVFDVFSNYLIKYVKPHIWLSACILAFGVVSIGMGFVTNFGGLAACRFLIGMSEASTFPSLFYLLSTYYNRLEAQKRFSAFFSVTCLAGAASGAIAYRINDLDGVHGLSSWQWIFVIDGIITAGGAIILFFTVADFPEESRFLKENEKLFLKEKLVLFSGAESGYETNHSLGDVARCFKDYLIWLPALAYFGLVIPSYGYAYFAATIINQMGYKASSANQHSVYPWLAAFGLNNILSFVSDRTKRRLPFAIGCCLIAIVGLALILGERFNPQARYAGCFLTASGLYTAMPLLVCWTSINFGGHLRKSVGTAWQIGFGNIGGIISTYIFLAKDAPVYKPGLSVSLAFVSFAIVSMLLYFFSVHRLNRIKTTDNYVEKFNALSEKEKVLAGDKNPNFVYSY